MSPRSRWVIGAGVAGLVLFWCYLLQSETAAVSSDAASVALQAWDMLHGNYLMHGWVLADLSWYTTEVPEYVLVEAVLGLNPVVVHVCAALTYTLLVLLAALLGRGSSAGREGVLRAVVAGGIMVAPGLTPGTGVLLMGPNHTGTGVPILVAALLMDRLPPRWYVPVAVFVLLTIADVADPLAIFAASLPVALVCLMRALRDWRALLDLSALRGGKWGWFDGSLAASALLSIPAAAWILRMLHALGGFYVHPVKGGTGFAQAAAMSQQTWTFIENVLALFGADFFGQPLGLAAAFDLLHLAGVGLAAWALCAGLRRFFGDDADRVSQVLVAGLVIVGCAGLFGTHMTGLSGAHEIAVILPLGAAAAGRLLGRRLLAAGLAPVVAVVLAGYLFALGYDVTRPAAPAQNADLTAWLQTHGLRSGLGGYWQANSIRLDSHGTIAMVAPTPGRVSVYGWETNSRWLNPATSSANFLVSVSGPPAEADAGQVRAAYQLFGPPAHIYHYGRYTIAVWKKNLLQALSGHEIWVYDKNLLDRLTRGAFAEITESLVPYATQSIRDHREKRPGTLGLRDDCDAASGAIEQNLAAWRLLGPGMVGDQPGCHRRGVVYRIPAPGQDHAGEFRCRRDRAAGMGHAARQRGFARLAGGGRVVLHDGTARVRPGGALRRPAAGRGPHQRGADLHADRLADRAGGPRSHARRRGGAARAYRRNDRGGAVTDAGVTSAAAVGEPHGHGRSRAGGTADS
jgi:hypothetical protein